MELNLDEPRPKRGSTIKLMEEDFMPANLQRAKKHLIQTSIRTAQGKKVKFCESVHIFEKYSLGVYLYLSFLKKLTICMAIVSAIALIPLVSNVLGKYFRSTDSTTIFDQTTLGNQIGISFQEENEADALSALNQLQTPKYITLFSDITYCVVLIVFLVFFKFNMEIQIQRDRVRRSSARHYAIQVKGLPKSGITEQQVKKFFQERFGPVVEVIFAREYGDTLNKFKKRAALLKKIEIRKVKLEIQKEEATGDRKLQKLEQKLRKLDENIAQKHPDITSLKQLPINRAFLLFERVEDKIECMKKFMKVNKFRLCCYCCCMDKKNEHFKYEGNHLVISEPDEPSSIKWQNLEVTKCGRAKRKALIAFIGVIAFVICFIFIYYLKFIQLNSVTYQECIAFTNLNSQTVDQTAIGDHRFCWCKNFGVSNILSNSEYRNNYCYDFLLEYIEETSLKVGLSFIIIQINFILKIIMRIISFFIRYESVNTERVESMVNMFLVLFINTGVLILVINGNLTQTFIGASFTHIPIVGVYIFNGDYGDYTRKWFIYVGTSIIIIMFVNIIMPPISGFMFYIIKKWARCCCKHRAVIQRDLNNLFKGPDYDIAYSGAQFLANFYITLMYCNGCPLLLPIFLIYVFFRYWTDKCMLLRHYCAPPSYDDRFPAKIVSAMPYAVLIHLLLSLWVYTSPYIFPGSYQAKNNNGTTIYVAMSPSHFWARVFQAYTIPLLIFIAVFIVLYGLTSIFFRIFKCCCRQKRELSQKIIQGTFSQVKDRIFGINSYNPMKNDKYRLLITAVMKVLKSGSHSFEVVEQVVDETHEEEEMSIPEEANEIEELNGLRKPTPKKQNFFSKAMKSGYMDSEFKESGDSIIRNK